MMKMMERAHAVKAMETLARCINDEDILDSWLMVGVADGDINTDTTPEEIKEMGYCDDDTFADLMKVFVRCMNRAYKSGGLYCGGICAGER